MAAIMFRGSPSFRDYTPPANVTAGNIIDIGGMAYVCHTDIASGELGALSCPAGTAAYKVDLDPTLVVADGAAVNVNPATGNAESSGTPFGIAEGAADGTAGDSFVIVRLV